MKIPKSIIEEDYEFFNKNYGQQVQVYVRYFRDFEVPDLERYKKTAPAYRTEFRENIEKITNLFLQRYKEKEILDFGAFNMAFEIIYLTSAVSHIGFTYTDLSKIIDYYPQKSKAITDYLLNTLDIFDWFKETQEYKVWLEHEEWKKANPNYFKKPEKPEELDRVILFNRIRIKTGRYSKDKVLSKIR